MTEAQVVASTTGTKLRATMRTSFSRWRIWVPVGFMTIFSLYLVKKIFFAAKERGKAVVAAGKSAPAPADESVTVVASDFDRFLSTGDWGVIPPGKILGTWIDPSLVNYVLWPAVALLVCMGVITLIQAMRSKNAGKGMSPQGGVVIAIAGIFFLAMVVTSMLDFFAKKAEAPSIVSVDLYHAEVGEVVVAQMGLNSTASVHLRATVDEAARFWSCPEVIDPDPAVLTFRPKFAVVGGVGTSYPKAALTDESRALLARNGNDRVTVRFTLRKSVANPCPHLVW